MSKLTATAASAAVILMNMSSAEQATTNGIEIEAHVFIGGQPAGQYRESTSRHNGRTRDTVEQLFVINRLGSKVEIQEKDVYEQDSRGRIVSGHTRTSSSKTSVTMDYEVQGNKLALVTHSGGHDYRKEIPISGDLLGPAGMRQILMHSNLASPQQHYQTFVPSLGGESRVTLKYLGLAKVNAIQTRRFEETVEGLPGALSLWVDPQGYTAQMTMPSPFGPIEVRRGEAPTLSGTESKEEYEGTLAISNIKLPHPRLLRSITLEITKHAGADAGWPEFAYANQMVLQRDADHVVLKINQPAAGDASAASPIEADSQPNVLMQSDDPKVLALARTIVGSETDPWKKALRLQDWVAANMHFDTGIAVAPASELVRDRHGTCMGYAILLATLARSQGIPSHIRIGYVYDAGIWGGHAWTEMYVHDRWLPLDSAEYHSGIADAARFGVITVEGDNGTIEHIGELALLFGKIEVRTLSYTLGDVAVAVAKTAPDHTMQIDEYTNPWLGLRVHKPAGFTFADLDAHWPDRSVLKLKSAKGVARIEYTRAQDEPLDKQMSDALGVHGSEESAAWGGAQALRIDGGGKAALGSVKGDAVWAIVAEGPNAASLLDDVLAGTSIAELAAR